MTSWFEASDDEPGTGVYRWLLICRIVLGACEAGHWPCALLTVRAILSAKDRTLGNGILQSGASIGAILVPLYVQAAERAASLVTFAAGAGVKALKVPGVPDKKAKKGKK